MNTTELTHDIDEEFKQWAKDRFSSLTGNALFNYGGNTEYALARYLFAELLGKSNADLSAVIKYHQDIVDSNRAYYKKYYSMTGFGYEADLANRKANEHEQYIKALTARASLPAEQDAEIDFPKIKYEIATSLVELNQRILDNKGLSGNDLEEMQQLINAYNY